MLLKVMSADGRTFEVISDVRRCRFRADGAGFAADVVLSGGLTECVPLPGSAFVLNEGGVTIERFLPPEQEKKQ